MIYLDSAATTKYKPDKTYEAFSHYVREVGVSPGRGSYSLGIEASRMLYQSRKTMGTYFGLMEPTNVVFTKNSTEAINLFFNGFLSKGDHVLITCYEHNAVLRPLHTLMRNGIIEYSVIEREDIDKDGEYLLSKYGQKNTRLIVSTLASNLTGRVVFNESLFLAAHGKGITTFIDASQGAGKIRLSMQQQSIDYLAFTGHKDLMGLPGVGGLCCKEKHAIKPLIQGGTGIFGDSYINPSSFPEGLEAGTLNMPAIWALKEAVDYCVDNNNELQENEKSLLSFLMKGLKTIPGITIYDEEFKRVSTVGFNIEGITSDKLVRYLDQNNIAVRGGIHCAILAHKALGTVNSGVVRVSLSPFNKKEELITLIEVLMKARETICI
nr:MAG TPA: cysteine desulfurase [Inoviridae sp.]